jgi:hypothetical protein
MKLRPTRIELLGKFFPELTENVSKGDKEAAIQLNARACEAILADQTYIFDKGFERLGPGVLCVRIHKGSKDSEYLPLTDLTYDRDNAEKNGDTDISDSLNKVIEKVEGFNFQKGVLIMLVDNSTLQVFPLDREYPAQSIQAMLEEFST